jgi:hypothetical protein
MSELRDLLSNTLIDAGMLIDGTSFDRTRREAASSSKRHLAPSVDAIGGCAPAEIAASAGVSPGALARWFGHGWQLATGFATFAGVRPNRVASVARLGGLFNLGVVLLDHVMDTLPERRGTLLRLVTPELLRSVRSRPPVSDDIAVDFVVGVARAVVSGAYALGGRPEDLDRFTALVGEMYEAERASVELRRIPGLPPPEAWDVLRAKSALPATALALLALLANPTADRAHRESVECAAANIGEAFWIVDDLADLPSDWVTGCWSRPLWLLLRQPGENPDDAAQAIERLLDTGIAAAEARRLTTALADLAECPGASHRALLRPVQAAVRSWIEEIPADAPSYAGHALRAARIA